MKAGDMLLAGGITISSLTLAGRPTRAQSQPAAQESTCTEEEKAAIHQYLLEQGLLEMEAIFADACSDANNMEGFLVRTEPEEPKPKTPEK